MHGEVVDFRARQDAGAALARIDRHEAVCTERYAQLAATGARVETRLAELKTSQRALYNRWWLVLTGVIGAQFAAILLLLGVLLRGMK